MFFTTGLLQVQNRFWTGQMMTFEYQILLFDQCSKSLVRLSDVGTGGAMGVSAPPPHYGNRGCGILKGGIQN